MRVRVLPAVVALALCAGRAAAGTTEELIRLQTDVLQLTNQVQSLHKSLVENDAVLRTLLEQLSDRFAELKVSLDGLNQTLGQNATQTAQVIQNSRADTKMLADQVGQSVQALSLKLDDANGRIASLSQKVEETNRVQAEKMDVLTGVGANIPPDQLYAAAYNDYLLGNYDLAIQAFRDYLERFKDSEMADDALYYVGVSYFDQKKHDQALQAFDQLIQMYPKGSKLATAHFKRAMAMQALQQVTDSVKQLQYVYGTFPDSPESSLAEQELRKMGVEPVAPARRRR
jgi:tol-pal system protein YbgF